MLDGMCAPGAHPSACGTPSVQTPSSQGNPFVLPRIMVAAPRAHDRGARQPDQRRPVRGGG
eukprot:1424245-Alexandrium_andersonii.AAC.1